MAVTLGTTNEYTQLLHPLLDEWAAAERNMVGRRGADQVHLISVFALASHTHRLVRAAVRLHDDGLDLEAMPLIRSAFEHALTAQWLAQYPDAAIGFYREGLRNTRNLAKTVADIGWQKAADALDQFNQQSAGAAANQSPGSGKLPDDPSDVAAKKVEKLCSYLEGAETTAYAMYRILCGYTHPSPRIVESYVQTDPLTAYTSPVLYDKATVPLWLLLLCSAVVWAARAFDMLEDGHPRRNELRRAADQLGIPCQFQLSGSFKKAEQAHRQANWKRPSVP